MKKWSDEELINALRERLAADRQDFDALSVMTRKLEEMNRKLQESEALKSHFLSNIRNEINNPLTSIAGLAGQIAGGRRPEQAADFARMICVEAHFLDSQLQNIFMAADLESGAATPEWSQVEVVGVIENLCETVSWRCQERQMKIERQLGPELTFVTDVQKLAHIVANLLVNAIDFSPAGSTVGIRAEVRETTLRIEVTDAGPGIAEQDQERIFDRFCQLAMGSTKPHRGHGLGLSIARSLTQMLGGSLDLESARGRGSRFILSLPAPAIAAEISDLAADGNLFLFDETESF